MNQSGSIEIKLSGCDETIDISPMNENNMDVDKVERGQKFSAEVNSDNTEPMEADKDVIDAKVDDPIMPGAQEEIENSMNGGADNLKEDEPAASNSSQSDTRSSPGKNKNKLNSSDSDHVDEHNESSDNSGIAESSQPSCSTTKFHKLKSKVKKRHYRKKSTDTDDAKSKEKKPRENNDDSSTSSIEENGRTKRQGFTELKDDRVPSSSDEKSSNSDNEGGNSSEWITASEDELNGGVPRVLQKEQPKPKLFIVPEMLNRQIGNTKLFERRFYGSLHVVQRLELMQKMEEHEGCVNALNFNREGNLLASASDDLRVVIWDWAIGKKRHAFDSGHKGNVFESKWLPLDFESYIVTCARDRQVRLLNICTGVHRKLTSHQGPARRLAVHPDYPYTVISVGDDAKVLSIDIRGGKPTKMMSVKDGRSEMNLYSIHINPRNSNEFCVGGGSQAVKIYDRRKLTTPLQRLCPNNLSGNTRTHVTCAIYNYNGTEIIASYNDDDIYLFDTVVPHPSGDFAHRYEGHRNNATVKSVNFFGPKSEFIVSGSDCGNIFFWDKNTEAIVQWFPGDEQGVVNRLESHPNVPILATSGLDHDVKIWIPSCEQAPQMDKLEDCVQTNLRNRANDVTREPDAFDGQLLMVFLQQIRQHESFNIRAIQSLFGSGPRFMRPYDENSDSSSEAGSVHSDSPSEGPNEGPQCAPS